MGNEAETKKAYKPKNPELFQYNDNFIKKFISPLLHPIKEKSGEDLKKYIRETIANEVAEQLYQFQLYTVEYCNLLIEEAEYCGKWVTELEKRPEEHPMFPEDKDLVDICEPDTTVSFKKMTGLEDVYKNIVKDFMTPIVENLWVTFKLQKWDTPEVRKYEPEVINQMDLHYDLEIVSLVTYIGGPTFVGGGTYFPRWNLTVGSDQNLIQGSCVVYPGGVSHEHSANPITKGVRYMLSGSFTVINTLLFKHAPAFKVEQILASSTFLKVDNNIKFNCCEFFQVSKLFIHYINIMDVLDDLLEEVREPGKLGDELHSAIRRGDTDIVKEYLMQGILLPITCLFISNFNTRQYLQGADTEAKNNDGRTALLAAVFYQKTDLIEPLVSAGATILVTDFEGNSPLHLAVQANNVGLVREALGQGCNPNQQNLIGATPMHIACQLGGENKSLETMLRLLLEKGGDPNLKDKADFTAWHYAVNSQCSNQVTLLTEVIQMLQQADYEKSQKEKNPESENLKKSSSKDSVPIQIQY